MAIVVVGGAKTRKQTLLCCPGEPARIGGRSCDTEGEKKKKKLEYSRAHAKYIVTVQATSGGVSSVCALKMTRVTIKTHSPQIMTDWSKSPH